MKKCASCTKDLPDAALHCVFCGAKQPPAPAVAGSVAKTVMGHASQEVIDQLKAHAAAAARNPPPAAAPYTPPQPAPARPMPPSGPIGGFSPTPGLASPHGVPPAGSVAPTMFVPGGGPPGGPMGGPMGPPMGGPMAPAPMPGPPMGGGPMGGPLGGSPGPAAMPAPLMPAPIAPIPSASPPYLASRTAARAGRPIEPWKDALRLMMMVWGGVLLLAFMTPVTTGPDFMFQMIIDGEGTQKLAPLLIVAIGLLSLVLAFIPTSPMPRGLIAGLLGLCGIMIPLLLSLSKGDFGLGQIMLLIGFIGILTLIPGLLLRSEYRDSIMPRIMVTIGALCILVPDLIPKDSGVPLVNTFKAIIDAEGAGKVMAIITLGLPLLAVLSLLAWLPAPSSGGAKVFAWLFITYYAISHFSKLLIGGHIGDMVAASPYSALMGWAPITSYLVLVGYGFATVFAKKLE